VNTDKGATAVNKVSSLPQ